MASDVDIALSVKHPLIAAMLGALVGLRFAPGLTWAQRAFNATSSVALAMIFGPMGSDMLGLSETGASALSGGIALFGLGLADQVQGAIKAGEWRSWIPGLKTPTKGD